MQIDREIERQYRNDVALAEHRVLIAELHAALIWLEKTWARNGYIDYETTEWAETQDLFARLSQIDSLFDELREIDPRSELKREWWDDEIKEKLAKAVAPIVDAYRVKHPMLFTREAA